jgi:hypothetical protein
MMKSVASFAVLLTATNGLVRNELVLQDAEVVGEVVTNPRPHEYLKLSELPASLDYRTEGLLTTDLNQHIPVYCGSCWSEIGVILFHFSSFC